MPTILDRARTVRDALDTGATVDEVRADVERLVNDLEQQPAMLEVDPVDGDPAHVLAADKLAEFAHFLVTALGAGASPEYVLAKASLVGDGLAAYDAARPTWLRRQALDELARDGLDMAAEAR